MCPPWLCTHSEPAGFVSCAWRLAAQLSGGGFSLWEVLCCVAVQVSAPFLCLLLPVRWCECGVVQTGAGI